MALVVPMLQHATMTRMQLDDGSCTFPASANVDCDGNCLVAVDCAVSVAEKLLKTSAYAVVLASLTVLVTATATF